MLIEHVDKIVGLRRNLVLEESRFPEELTGSFNNMERYQNIWGQPQASRLDWAQGTAVRGAHSRAGGRRRRARTRWRSSSACTGSAAPRRSTTATGGSPEPW